MLKEVLKRDLSKLHIMNSFDSLAWSMVGIFIPVYFYTLGYSLKQIFVYYIIQNLAILATAFIVIFIARKISLQKVLIIRFPFLLLFLFLLYNASFFTFPINYLAIIDGFQAMLFYFPVHIFFSYFADKKNHGESISRLFAIPQFVTIFGPLIGGLIVLKFGFKALFIFVTVLFFIDFIPIMFTKIINIDYSFHFKDGIDLYKKYKKYFFSELFNNIGEEIEGVIWPLFVYISLINIASVGIVGTLLTLSSALFTMIIGKYSDKHDKTRMIKMSAVLIAIVWFMRYYFGSEIALYSLTVLSGAVYVVFSVPYYSIFYQISQKEKTAVFFAFREVPVAIARIIVFSLGIIFAVNLKVLFIFAGLSYFMFLFWKSSIDKKLA